MGFGLRISEAFAIEEDDLFGLESIKQIKARNDFITRIVDKELGALDRTAVCIQSLCS